MMALTIGTSSIAQPNSGAGLQLSDIQHQTGGAAYYTLRCDAFIYAMDWAKLNSCWDDWVIVTDFQYDAHYGHAVRFPITSVPWEGITIYEGRVLDPYAIASVNRHDTTIEKVTEYILNAYKFILPPL